jgi:hypothetical protein
MHKPIGHVTHRIFFTNGLVCVGVAMAKFSSTQQVQLTKTTYSTYVVLGTQSS